MPQWAWGNTSGPVETGFDSEEEAIAAAPKGSIVAEHCPLHPDNWYHSCPGVVVIGVTCAETYAS